MVSVGTTFPIHGARARYALLACGFAATAAMGALAATLLAQVAPASQAATPPAGTHVALYVQIQSSHPAATAGALDEQAGQTAAANRLYLQTVLVNSGRDAAPAPRMQDFTVRAADGRVWPVSVAASDFSTRALQPGEQRGLNMYVDLPASASQLRLVMRHLGQVQSIPLVS